MLPSLIASHVACSTTSQIRRSICFQPDKLRNLGLAPSTRLGPLTATKLSKSPASRAVEIQ